MNLKGRVFRIGGHQMHVKEVKPNETGYSGGDRVVMSCAPHCCTRPYNVEMEMAVQTLLRDFTTAEEMITGLGE